MSRYASAAAARHIVTTLRGDATLSAALGAGKVHQGVAPEGAAYPLVLVQSYTSPVDTTYNGGARAMTVGTYSVRVVGHGDSMGPLLPIVQRVDELLHDSEGIYPEGDVVACHRTEETEMAEVRAGRTVRYLGGRYSIVVA